MKMFMAKKQANENYFIGKSQPSDNLGKQHWKNENNFIKHVGSLCLTLRDYFEMIFLQHKVVLDSHFRYFHGIHKWNLYGLIVNSLLFRRILNDCEK